MIPELLKHLADSLDYLEIPYMISGGIALNAYTVPRLTRDIDIVIVLKEEQVDRFMDLFMERFYLVPETIRAEVRRKGMFNIIDNETGFKIDFIVRKDSDYRKAEFDRRISTEIFGFELWIVTIEDLILSKLEWIQVLQSEKQMDDIRALIETRDVDLDYVRRWCEFLHLNTFNLIPLE